MLELCYSRLRPGYYGVKYRFQLVDIRIQHIV
jgi:hypothetical protein